MVDIVIADDHVAFAEALATVLDDDRRRVVAVASTASGALAALEDRAPDLCVLDRWFSDGDGFALLPALAAASPGTRIVVITADPDRDGAAAALDRGAHGFVHKTRGVSALLGCLDRVLDGETVVELPPRWTAQTRGPERAAPSPAVHLTGREQQCLALLVDGAGTAEIATRLGVSVTTVHTHVRSVLTKLGVHTRLEAAAHAVRHGLVPVSGEA